MHLPERRDYAFAEPRQPLGADRERIRTGAKTAQFGGVGQRLDLALRQIADQRKARQLDDTGRFDLSFESVSGIGGRFAITVSLSQNP